VDVKKTMYKIYMCFYTIRNSIFVDYLNVFQDVLEIELLTVDYRLNKLYCL